MSYRKLNADRLFTGFDWLDDQHVLVLKADGTIEGIVPIAEAGDDIEKSKGTLCPGFINCHCHLELSHLKGTIPRETGMLSFIQSVMGQRGTEGEKIEAAMELAEQEMITQGIVATGDICNTSASLFQKRKGNMYYHNFIELSGFIPSTAGTRFEQGVAIFNEFAQQYGLPVDSISIVPHSPYSVSGELLRLITAFPGNHLLCMHNQESIAENMFMKEKAGDFLDLYKGLGLDISFWKATGKSGLSSVLSELYTNQSIILVHNVFLTEEDCQLIRQSKKTTYLCLCPNANLFIGNGLPNLTTLLNSGLPIVLGTDSLASNAQLSIWEEMKTLHLHNPHISIDQMLPWATINGARALEMDSLLGSFEQGKNPGVLLIEEGKVRRLDLL